MVALITPIKKRDRSYCATCPAFQVVGNSGACRVYAESYMEDNCSVVKPTDFCMQHPDNRHLMPYVDFSDGS